jgi:peptidyl-prolyl cis-trans isomerase B (cyclophilin B)
MMRKSLIVLTLCLLLTLVLCSCDMQGLVGELQGEKPADQTVGLGGFAGAMEIIGTDENGNYIAKGENGTYVVNGDAFFDGEGSFSVIIGGNGSFQYEVSIADPLSEVDAYEADAFVPTDKETDYVKITVRDYGEIVIRLHARYAPATVENFKKLVGQGFYDGLVFHRIIQNFMIQGGGYDESGELHKTDAIKGEFEANGFKNTLKHARGVISMARRGEGYTIKDGQVVYDTGYDSGSCQFFIVHKDSLFLDGKYAAFGWVTEGMEVVDAIAKNVPVTDNNGTVKAGYAPVIEYIKVIK